MKRVLITGESGTQQANSVLGNQVKRAWLIAAYALSGIASAVAAIAALSRIDFHWIPGWTERQIDRCSELGKCGEGWLSIAALLAFLLVPLATHVAVGIWQTAAQSFSVRRFVTTLLLLALATCVFYLPWYAY